jgi:hypothetical protein
MAVIKKIYDLTVTFMSATNPTLPGILIYERKPLDAQHVHRFTIEAMHTVFNEELIGYFQASIPDDLYNYIDAASLLTPHGGVLVFNNGCTSARLTFDIATRKLYIYKHDEDLVESDLTLEGDVATSTVHFCYVG